MQFKLFSATFILCLTAVILAAPVPVEIPPLDVEARTLAARERVTEVARSASPDPGCSRYTCL